MAEVRFVGGPADGRYQEYPGEEPPQIIEVWAPRPGPWFGAAHEAPDELVATRILYSTMVNPMNDDPRWLAVLLQEES